MLLFDEFLDFSVGFLRFSGSSVQNGSFFVDELVLECFRVIWVFVELIFVDFVELPVIVGWLIISFTLQLTTHVRIFFSEIFRS